MFSDKVLKIYLEIIPFLSPMWIKQYQPLSHEWKNYSLPLMSNGGKKEKERNMEHHEILSCLILVVYASLCFWSVK